MFLVVIILVIYNHVLFILILILFIVRKKWYNVNDTQVDEITCPYVNGIEFFLYDNDIVEDHPWRPSNRIYRTFSVKPSCFINTTTKEIDEEGKDWLIIWLEIEALSYEEEIPIEELFPLPRINKKPVVKKEVTEKPKGKPVLKKKKKKSQAANDDSEEDDEAFGPCKGGSARFRRMATNSTSLQSAYMCL